ncbi:hypothetical protein [Nocardioides taihuensis]|uniref:DUF946 domain-containing protein n=1 Tax=Nocardioides taihuensis TaxID=1835606 RepID=A0ABW0BHH4_9ACTN
MTSTASRLRPLLAVVAAVVGAVLALPATAHADTSGEQRLAETYAPLIRLVAQPQQCGAGEPYHPSDVDLLLGDPSVALRGPWTQDDLVTIGPDAKTLSTGLPGYALDFPGDPLRPGCDYEQWADRVWARSPTTVYAHVATEPAYPGRLALQYWFYYPFNDFNNKHESDWEGIQVEFDADSVAQALESTPTRVVYGQHESAESSAWDDPKLDVQDGTHPVVYVSAGSHSSHFEPGLFLLRSRTQGLGCDTTLGTDPGVTPVVRTIPADPAAARTAYPWLGYQGLWGQHEPRSIYEGPTGPSTKERWTAPFTWSSDTMDRSYAVPGGSLYGGQTTAFFCGAVGEVSVTLLQFTSNPVPVVLGLALVLAVVVWLVRRTSWRRSEPFPLQQQRTFGQTVSVAWLVYRTRWRLFLGIGLVVALASLVNGVVQQLVVEPLGQSVDQQLSGASAAVTLCLGLATAFVALLAQMATMRAVAELDAGRPVGVLAAYRSALRRTGPVLGTQVMVILLAGLLLVTVFLAPLAFVLVLAGALILPVTVLEPTWGYRALRRSAHLVRGQVPKLVGLVVFMLLVSGVLGGLLGSLVLLVVQAPFLLVNLLPGVVTALVGPFLTLLLTYAYFHGLAYHEHDAAPTDPSAGDEAESVPVPG